MFFKRKKRPVAVVAHTGTAWSAHVYAPQDGLWTEQEAQRFPASSHHDMPDDLLAFAARNEARTLRIFVPADVRAVSLELPEDHDLEEAQAALAFELAEEGEAWDLRVAAARADVFGMGGSPEEILAAPFSNSQMERLEASCRAHGLTCDGMGSLELAVLAHHAGLTPDARCLLACETSCFYATPLLAMNPFAVQGLAATLNEEERKANPDKYERIKRRFSALGQAPAEVWAPCGMDDAQRDLIRSLLGPGEITFHALEDHLVHILLPAAEQKKPGGIHEGCALAGKAAKPRDPHRAGTWIAVTVLLGGLAFMTSSYHSLKADLQESKARLRAWETLTYERNALEKRSDSLLDRRNGSQRLVKMLQDIEPLPQGLMPLLDLLAGGMPPYTRITAVHQADDGAILIEGSSLYQDGLNHFIHDIGNTVRPYGMIVDSPGLENGTTPNELLFTYRISRAEGVS